MKFPFKRYNELPLSRRNTLQIYITNNCNLKCKGCFARYAMGENKANMVFKEYESVINSFLNKNGKQINLLGGEPLLHPNLKDFLNLNRGHGIKTTIYTNGYFLNKYKKEDFKNIKIRTSVFPHDMKDKNILNLPKTDIPFDTNFMITKTTTLKELLECAYFAESNYNSKVFFIFSMRELDNSRQEFFDDTEYTMPVIKYKELVHQFMTKYIGGMDIHVSKRGVFESTTTLPDTKCRFANYFIGGKIIQCPYDVVNLKYQDGYLFNERNCQQNNTCLMSKVIYRPI